MEFSLDSAFVRGILAQEQTAACADIEAAGPLHALAESQQRHDARVASAPDFGTLACCAGCTWCCHFTVDVRAVEVFRILDFVERFFTDEEKARVRTEVRANATTLK